MRNLFIIPTLFFLLILNLKTTAQSVSGYFETRGVSQLSEMAHITNDYISGEYSLDNQNIFVYIKSKDNVFGASVYTELTIERGFGGLYFSNIIVNKDNDSFPPFEAFGITNQMAIEIFKSIDKETVAKIRDEIIEKYGTNIEQWNGRMWALFVLNLDYYSYILGN